MSNYDTTDNTIKDTDTKSVGKKVDKRVKELNGSFTLDDLDEWEFEEEWETFERIPRKTKKSR